MSIKLPNHIKLCSPNYSIISTCVQQNTQSYQIVLTNLFNHINLCPANCPIISNCANKTTQSYQLVLTKLTLIRWWRHNTAAPSCAASWQSWRCLGEKFGRRILSRHHPITQTSPGDQTNHNPSYPGDHTIHWLACQLIPNWAGGVVASPAAALGWIYGP